MGHFRELKSRRDTPKLFILAAKRRLKPWKPLNSSKKRIFKNQNDSEIITKIFKTRQEPKKKLKKLWIFENFKAHLIDFLKTEIWLLKIRNLKRVKKRNLGRLRVACGVKLSFYHNQCTKNRFKILRNNALRHFFVSAYFANAYQ